MNKVIRKSSKINRNGPLSVLISCVWTHGAPVFVGFAPQCGKHLLKGFQVQFGVLAGPASSLARLLCGLTSQQFRCKTFPRQESTVVHKTGYTSHCFPATQQISQFS